MPNRLSLEDSPYLQQHKDNPFNWYPWCDEAFEKAKNENKPIFISIGYSSCHGCHVMEREVFENETIATFVNDNFVCIKVDCEERPDIGKHSQELYQILNRKSGGWPLSIFATPQNKPFYAATHMNLETQDQKIGFSELCTIITDKIAANDEKLFRNADEISQFLHVKSSPTEATRLTNQIVSTFLKQALEIVEYKNNKFSILHALLALEYCSPEPKVRTLLTESLDQLKHPFASTLYDRALLCELYTKAAQTYQESRYSSIAHEIVEYVFKNNMEENLFEIDNRVITTWNAMVIRSLFILGKTSDQIKYQAIRSLQSLLDVMIVKGTLYHTALIHKTPKIEAFLEDYAYLCAALIEGYQSTFDEYYLIEAQRLANKALELYYENGRWYFSRGQFSLIAPIEDDPYPSAVAVMVDSLLSLGELIDQKYRHFAFKTLEYHSYKLMREPTHFPALCEQAIRYIQT